VPREVVYEGSPRWARSTIQELLGHSHVDATMIYTHVLNRRTGALSPLDDPLPGSNGACNERPLRSKLDRVMRPVMAEDRLYGLFSESGRSTALSTRSGPSR
jgi:hypothetical protein